MIAVSLQCIAMRWVVNSLSNQHAPVPWLNIQQFMGETAQLYRTPFQMLTLTQTFAVCANGLPLIPSVVFWKVATASSTSNVFWYMDFRAKWDFGNQPPEIQRGVWFDSRVRFPAFLPSFDPHSERASVCVCVYNHKKRHAFGGITVDSDSLTDHTIVYFFHLLLVLDERNTLRWSPTGFLPRSSRD